MAANYFGYRFRAWDTSEERMYYPDELEQLEGIWYEENPDGSFVQKSVSKKFHRKAVDRCLRFGLANGDWENRRSFVVMLSTGKTDITGKEIWELDKVNGRGALNSVQNSVIGERNFKFSALTSLPSQANPNPSAVGLANGNALKLIISGNYFQEENREDFETSSEGGCSIGGSATASQGTSVDYNQEIVDLAPWYRWTFNNTWNDSGYGTNSSPRNGSNVGAVFTTDGGIIPNESWECGDFTPNDEVRISDSPRINSGSGYSFVKRSISVWANFDNVNSGDQNKGRIVWEQGGGTNWWSIYTYNGSIYSCIGEGRPQDGFTLSSISTSTLYLIVVTIDLSLSSNQMKLYINGSLEDQATTSVGSSLANHSGNIAWGGPNSSPRNHLNTTITNNMDGKLADGCYWYEEVLTPSEISDIWDAGTSS